MGAADEDPDEPPRLAAEEPSSRRAALHAGLAAARELLPAQNPLGHFIHHNPLHALEDRPFQAAVAEASARRGAAPWPAWDEWRAAWRSGRVTSADIAAALDTVDDEPVSLPGLRLPYRDALRRLMLAPHTGADDSAVSGWSRAEAGLLRQLPPDLDRDAAERLWADGPPAAVLQQLWDACAALAPPPPERPPGARLGVLALEHLGQDLDGLVEPQLVRVLACFLDAGQATWPMPGRERGLWICGLEGLTSAGTTLLPGGAALRARAKAALASRLQAEDAALALLAQIGVPPEETAAFVEQTLYALPGFAGMVERLHRQPALCPTPAPGRPARSAPATLIEVLALRLLWEETSLRWLLARSTGAAAAGPLWPQVLRWRPAAGDTLTTARRTAPLFHVALSLGLPPSAVAAATTAELDALRRLAGPATDHLLRWLWLQAFERGVHEAQLDALVLHRAATAGGGEPPCEVHVITCVDDREESLRRHLELTSPQVRTWATAGFFGLALRIHRDRSQPGRQHCPAPQAPSHALLVPPTTAPAGASAAARIGAALRGPLAAWADLWRLLRPDAAPVRGPCLDAAAEAPLQLDHVAGARLDGLPLGYTPAEMADVVAAVLGELGWRADGAAVVAVLGHGSTSVNNPHAAGYQCGACAGAAGGINARVFAAMANRADVRALLVQRGVALAADLRFVSGLHDTTTDRVELNTADTLAAVPAGSERAWRTRLVTLRQLLDRALEANARERTRRLRPAMPFANGAAALRHVTGRASDLAQARPEYNHATHATCVVGRRELTRGLFLDRRAFLVSYDPVWPDDDGAGTRLAAALAATAPVCAGINLEYWFSRVDNERWGAGTKLPHNVTGLLGVMNGAKSDLRTGLVAQMVEIHEPVRLLIVVEAAPAIAAAALAQVAAVRRLVVHEWVRYGCVDPGTGEAWLWRSGGFRPYALRTPRLDTLTAAAAARRWCGEDGAWGEIAPFAVSATADERAA